MDETDGELVVRGGGFLIQINDLPAEAQVGLDMIESDVTGFALVMYDRYRDGSSLTFQLESPGCLPRTSHLSNVGGCGCLVWRDSEWGLV